MQVIISNLPPETTKEMLQEELQGRNIHIVDLEFEKAGDPNKVSVIVTLNTGYTGARTLEKRVHGKYWHGRMLRAYTLTGLGKSGSEKGSTLGGDLKCLMPELE